MIRLFTITNNNDLEIPEIEILAYKELHRIFKRDKASNKAKALKEFMFIFHCYDYRSDFYNDISDEKKRIKKVAEYLEFPKDFIPDVELSAAMKRYKSLVEQSTPSIKLLLQLLKTFTISTELVAFIQQELTKSLSKLSELSEADVSVENQVQMGVLINIIKDNIRTVQDYTMTLPKQIESLESLRKKVDIEHSNQKVASGGKDGRAVGNREDVDYLNRIKSKPDELEI